MKPHFSKTWLAYFFPTDLPLKGFDTCFFPADKALKGFDGISPFSALTVCYDSRQPAEEEVAEWGVLADV